MLVLSSREEAVFPGQARCLSEDRSTVTPASTPNARSQAGQGAPRRGQLRVFPDQLNLSLQLQLPPTLQTCVCMFWKEKEADLAKKESPGRGTGKDHSRPTHGCPQAADVRSGGEPPSP